MQSEAFFIADIMLCCIINSAYYPLITIAKLRFMPKQTKENSSPGFLLPNLCADNTLLLLLMAVQLVVIAFIVFEYGFRIDWVYFGQASLYVQWQVIVSVVILCAMRQRLASMPKYLAAATAYGIIFAVAVVIAILVAKFMAFDRYFVAKNTLLSLIMGGLGLRYLYVQQQVVERERAMLQASLAALQAKIRPHFLFNTMNSIASLISVAPEKAEAMVVDLSELLRASLRDNMAETTLQEEWQLCESYLAIEQQRLGERLRWHCDFSALNLQTPIATFSLQPLIENAIYHGIQKCTDEGFIAIKGWQEAGHIQIEITNSQCLQSKKSSHRGNRMAVENIRLRMVKLYGESARLELRDENQHFVVHLSYNVNNKATI